MPWETLSDLPFAAALAAHAGGLSPEGAYDTVHFDQMVFKDAAATGSRFLDCAFTQVSMDGGQLRRSRFTDVWLRDVQLVGTGLAETDWMDSQFSQCAVAGAEAYGARLRRVVLRGCKLDSVNFRDAALSEVTFDTCVLRDVDFSGATLTRTAFPGSRLSGVVLNRVRMDRVDLRGAELGLVVDPGSLRGAIVSSAQLTQIAALLAESMGVTVEGS